MKATLHFSIFILFLFIGADLQSQFMGNPNMRRQRTAIPQTQTPPPQEPEKLTAEEYVDKELPRLVEIMELDPFEEAIVRSVLVKNVQKRMELQILKLEPQKMKEEFQKIQEQQDDELKASLPEEKYQTYLEMRENPAKTKRKKKKKKKNKD